MAIMNECCSCDKMFKNTKQNQGSICPECKEEIEKEHKAKAEADFWDYMTGRVERHNA